MASYLCYDELTNCLRELASASGGLCRLVSIGKSPEGRDIWLAEVHDPDYGAAVDRSALLVDANIHAGEVTGSAAALGLLQAVLEQNRQPGPMQELLRRHTLYVIPRLSPDGAELYLTTPTMLRSAPRAFPDGLRESGIEPEDLDGDHLIRQMRVQDSAGAFRKSEHDDRLMLPRRPGDVGPFYRILPEGRLLSDGDDQALHFRTPTSRPARFGLDFNRNFPTRWQPAAQQRGAGPAPLSEPETRALADFVQSRPNIAIYLTLHTSGGIIARPPATGDDEDLPARDLTILSRLGEIGSELTGYPCRSVHQAFGLRSREATDIGADEWAYMQHGLIAYTMELWDLDRRAGARSYTDLGSRRMSQRSIRDIEEDGLKRLQYADTHLPTGAFLPWTSHQHDQLGAVEIGGWDPKFAIQNPPPSLLADDVKKVQRFAQALFAALPHLALTKKKVRRLGGNLFALDLEVSNDGFLPTSGSERGRAISLTQGVLVTLDLPSTVHIIQGSSSVRTQELDGYVDAGTSYYSAQVEPQNHATVTFTMHAEPGSTITVRVEHPRAGRFSSQITLE